jgi:hypothetical protein
VRSPFDIARSVAVTVVVVGLACGGTPATVKPADSPKNNTLLSEVANRCARIVSCADSHDASQFRDPSTCVDWWLVNVNAERPLADCVMRATTCPAVHACTHEHEDRTAAAYCAAHPGVFSACDGKRFISCEGDQGQESTLVDCATLGGTCGQHDNGGLVVRGCVSPSVCPPNAPERRCEGDALIGCEGDIAERSVCSKGTHCRAAPDENGSPSASCEVDGATRCTSASMARCEGDVAVACVVNGRYPGVHRTSCADYGLTCAMRSGRTSCVSKNASACTVGSPARCMGDDLDFCAAGTELRVSCKELGFIGCAADGKGPSAACR